jgi:hypothetical protein
VESNDNEDSLSGQLCLLPFKWRFPDLEEEDSVSAEGL